MRHDPPLRELPLIRRERVARKLRRSLSWFERNRPSLEAAGFPRPVPAMGLRWDERAIDAWLDAQLPAYAGATDPADAAVAEAKAALRAQP